VKTILIIIVIIITIFVSFSPLLPSKRIEIESEIPISPNEIFWGYKGVYFTYFLKRDAEIERSFLKLLVRYTEEPILNIKFEDGLKGVTRDGFLIAKLALSSDPVVVNANVEEWRLFSALFLKLSERNLINEVKSLDFYEKNVAFFDKKGILIIIGENDLDNKLVRYLETIKIMNESNKIALVKIIDLRFKGESVIIWR